MRRNSYFWGIVIIIVGIMLFMDNMGILRVNVWGLIWPVFLVLLGMWFIWGRMRKSSAPVIQDLTIPLENAASAAISIRHGAGRLQIQGGSASVDLLSGSFSGGVVQTSNRLGDMLQIELRPPTEQGWDTFDHQGFSWDIVFNESIPMDFVLHTGASESQIDLSKLKVANFKLETGASSTQITMPAFAGMTHAQIKSGVAGVKISIPEGVAAQIQVSSGLAEIRVNEQRFVRSGNEYRSADYDTALNRLNLSIETGVGEVEVH